MIYTYEVNLTQAGSCLIVTITFKMQTLEARLKYRSNATENMEEKCQKYIYLNILKVIGVIIIVWEHTMTFYPSHIRHTQVKLQAAIACGTVKDCCFAQGHHTTYEQVGKTNLYSAKQHLTGSANLKNIENHCFQSKLQGNISEL